MEYKPTSQLFRRSSGSSSSSNGDAACVLVAINFRVPFELRQRMKLSAAIRGITMTELVTAALERYLEVAGSPRLPAP